MLASLIPISYAEDSCMCVAFRLDDVQDYWLSNVQRGVIDEFHKQNTSMTIGIIGNYFGNDASLVDFIKNKIGSSPEIEIANHGWNHEHFPSQDELTQEYLLDKTNQKVISLFGIAPAGFVAPYDDINNDTIYAVTMKKFGYLSTNETMSPPPYPLSGVSLYKLPETAAIGAVNDDNTNWTDYDIEHAHAQILRSITKYGFAVVTLHPQDFSSRHMLDYANSINQTRINQLDSVIDLVKNDGLKIVTMSEIPKNDNYFQKYPTWLDRVFDWYLQGHVSDDTMVNAIYFLKNNNIITFEPKFDSKYPLHQNITATYFWAGESASKDNQYTDNLSSTWDSQWVDHFGGVDDPSDRIGFLPAKFIPLENPFYFALPYDDFSNDGSRKHDANSVVYWSHEKNWNDSESMVKNRWIKIIVENETVYAQWEDAGPFEYDDKNYVFGILTPKNKFNNDAGLDVSPAVKDYLELFHHGRNKISWQFVNFDNVPDGPWKKIITTSQVNH